MATGFRASFGKLIRAVQPLLTPQRENALMLSPTTLTAFSPTIAQPGSGRAGPIQRVRAVTTQPAQPAAPADEVLALPGRDSGTPPGRSLPRGSLLDVSV
jgi:hypothetical protein